MKLRLSKTAQLVLGIGIFVIALVSLYVIYSRQGSEQEQLDDNLLVTQATLPKVVSEKENQERQLTQLESQLTQLESELAQATSVLAESRKSFPESVESIEYDERLFKIADEWNLEITSLTASEPDDEKVKVEVEDIKVEGITFSVTYFEVEVKGKAPELPFKTEAEYETYIDETVDDILDFIHTIRTDEYFTNATLELVNMDIPEPLTDEEIEEKEMTEEAIIEKAEKLTATIRLVIYSYKGE